MTADHSIAATAVAYITRAVVETATQLGLLLGPIAVLGLVMHLVSVGINRVARRALGSHRYLIVFGGLGTVMHEAFHAAACVVFRHRIVAIKWFDFNASDGALGSVTHTYNRKSLYQSIGNFFIGTAPLVGGALFVYAAARLLVGDVFIGPMREVGLSAQSFSSLTTVQALMRSIADGTLAMLHAFFRRPRFTDWHFVLFALLVFSVGSSAALSLADIRGAARGFVAFVALLLLINLSVLWAGNPLSEVVAAIMPFASATLTLMLFTIVLNVGAAVALLALPISINAIRGR